MKNNNKNLIGLEAQDTRVLVLLEEIRVRVKDGKVSPPLKFVLIMCLLC